MVVKTPQVSCGAWVVVQGKLTADGLNNKDRLKTPCPVPECGKEFAFDGAETRVFRTVPFPIGASPFLPI